MKKYLVFTVIAVLFMALPAQAQLKFGLKAGINLADVSFSNLEGNLNPSNYTGFQVGPIMEFTVPIVGIGMDAALLYSQTGVNLNIKGIQDVADIKETAKSGSILVPVNLKYKFGLMGFIGAYATAGPYVSLKVSDSLGELKNKLETKSFGAGLNLGVGVELLSKLQVGANYQLGLTDNYEKSSAWQMAGNAFKGKNRVWSITAAYFF